MHDMLLNKIIEEAIEQRAKLKNMLIIILTKKN